MIKIPDHNNFHFKRIMPDGRMVEIKFTKANPVENMLCCKFGQALYEDLQDLKRFQNKILVENFIKESMEKLRCRKTK